jgi:RNA polymerase sigma-70 factor (subfamily 1)
MENASRSACLPCAGDSAIDGCRNGDPSAWNRLHERMEQPLRQVAQHGLHKDLHAKVGVSDLVQDTFLLAHRSAYQFRGSSWGELAAWLKRILENQIAKTLRDQKWSQKRALHREVRLHEMRNQEPVMVEALTPSQILMAEEERELLDQALSLLPIADQELIADHYSKQMTFAEIAQRTQRNEAAVRKHWSRAMMRWKQMTDSLAGEP